MISLAETPASFKAAFAAVWLIPKPTRSIALPEYRLGSSVLSAWPEKLLGDNDGSAGAITSWAALKFGER